MDDQAKRFMELEIADLRLYLKRLNDNANVPRAKYAQGWLDAWSAAFAIVTDRPGKWIEPYLIRQALDHLRGTAADRAEKKDMARANRFNNWADRMEECVTAAFEILNEEGVIEGRPAGGGPRPPTARGTGARRRQAQHTEATAPPAT